jgi:quercetin dioxygenase-like cupin family protein
METIFNEGTLTLGKRKIELADLTWNAHPAFKGVYLKHLITGADTDGVLSCHLVKIDPGCSIGDHVHEGKNELHEVLQGNGRCMLETDEISYRPGVMTLIEKDKRHTVYADEQGLFIMAKFFPALI